MEQLKLSYIARGNVKNVQATWRTIWQLLIKLNIHVPYDSAVTFLGTYQEKCKHILTKGLVKEYS